MSHATRSERSEAAPAGPPLLESFFRAMRDSNPVKANRVTEPSPYDVDVATIHAAGFDRLVALADQARRERKGIGVVLLGGAGIGKSHLLSRLSRWAAERVEKDHPRAYYVYLNNILADPERLPRYLLKCVVSILSEHGRGRLHQSPLFQLVNHAVWDALKGAGARSANLKEGGDAYRKAFDRFPLGRDAYEVLFQFFRHAYPRTPFDPAAEFRASQAVAWLSGEEIEAEAARAVGLKVGDHESAMLRDDQDAVQVFLALTQLALLQGRPFILCVDQVDNLEEDNVKGIARFLHALLDHAANLLVIVSGGKETLLGFRRDHVISEAAWDRLAEFKVELKRVGREDVRRILEARLERFHESFVELEPVHRHIREDTLFPLGRQWLDDLLRDGVEFRPRDVLIWARDAWEAEQEKFARLGGARWLAEWPGQGKDPIPDQPPIPLEEAIDTAVDRKVEEQVSLRKLQPGSLPPDAGNLAGLVESLLGQCRGDGLPYSFRGVERMKKRAGRLPPYDLLVREQREGDGREITTGVLFVTNAGKSATDAIRRLLEDEHPPDLRLLVTDHERRPLTTGSQGAEYYRDLTRLGPEKFQYIKLTFEQYAALDGLEGAVTLARVGDLEVEWPRGKIRPVSEPEVIASHHRRDRYRHHPLLRPLLTEEPPVEPVKPPPVMLDPKDVRSFMMAQLSWRLGMSAHEITNGYLQAQPTLKLGFDEAMAQVKEIAGGMHAEGLLHATPTDDDLFLQLRK